RLDEPGQELPQQNGYLGQNFLVPLVSFYLHELTTADDQQPIRLDMQAQGEGQAGRQQCEGRSSLDWLWHSRTVRLTEYRDASRATCFLVYSRLVFSRRRQLSMLQKSSDGFVSGLVRLREQNPTLFSSGLWILRCEFDTVATSVMKREIDTVENLTSLVACEFLHSLPGEKCQKNLV